MSVLQLGAGTTPCSQSSRGQVRASARLGLCLCSGGQAQEAGPWADWVRRCAPLTGALREGLQKEEGGPHSILKGEAGSSISTL